MTGVELQWLEGFGYRCPECKLFVTYTKSSESRYCPRCPVVVTKPAPQIEDRPDTRDMQIATALAMCDALDSHPDAGTRWASKMLRQSLSAEG